MDVEDAGAWLGPDLSRPIEQDPYRWRSGGSIYPMFLAKDGGIGLGHGHGNEHPPYLL
jgi:hypothetical protein